jgi:hypothetical protein
VHRNIGYPGRGFNFNFNWTDGMLCSATLLLSSRLIIQYTFRLDTKGVENNALLGKLTGL